MVNVVQIRRLRLEELVNLNESSSRNVSIYYVKVLECIRRHYMIRCSVQSFLEN